MPRHDYTTVGHVCCDVLPDGTRQAGGTAFYSALQAARLGLRARIVTRGDPREIDALLAPHRDELALSVIAATHTTTLQTEGVGHARRQRVLAWAGQIGEEVEVDTAILHIAPVARETPHSWLGRADFVGITPQGLVREWDAAGEIALAPLHEEQLPGRCDAWVLNERECELCAAQLAHALAGGAVAAVTNGAHPVMLHLPPAGRPKDRERLPTAGRREQPPSAGAPPHGGSLRIPVPQVALACDDLGAGDVFAAAFFVALHERQPPARAAAFAAVAAAMRIAVRGPGAIADRAAIGDCLGAWRPG